jgi:hypothetical protein
MAIRYERSASRERATHLNIPTHHYSPEELAKIDSDYEHEEIRGATPRYWEDVKVGDKRLGVGSWHIIGAEAHDELDKLSKKYHLSFLPAPEGAFMEKPVRILRMSAGSGTLLRRSSRLVSEIPVQDSPSQLRGRQRYRRRVQFRCWHQDCQPQAGRCCGMGTGSLRCC